MNDGVQRYISKSLSFLLRHNNDANPIVIDPKGFAPVSAVVAAINGHSGNKASVTAENIAAAVSGDEKGRFQISRRPDGLYVRALSGHSFPVDIEGEDYLPSGPLWFGTTMEAYERIESHGLLQTTKLKARLRETREEAERIAAARKGGPLLVEVHAEALYRDGYRFTRLPNGEIVTDLFGRERCSLHPSATPTP